MHTIQASISPTIIAAAALFGFNDGNSSVTWTQTYQCFGYETRLFDCRQGPQASFDNCRGSNDAGAHCIGTTCDEGDLRLQGGSSDTIGRVEICHNNAWGTVCDDFWDATDARVACVQIGLPSSGEH